VVGCRRKNDGHSNQLFFLALFDYESGMCPSLLEGKSMKGSGGEPEPLKRKRAVERRW
jgi:hypothetical protein